MVVQIFYGKIFTTIPLGLLSWMLLWKSAAGMTPIVSVTSHKWNKLVFFFSIFFLYIFFKIFSISRSWIHWRIEKCVWICTSKCRKNSRIKGIPFFRQFPSCFTEKWWNRYSLVFPFYSSFIFSFYLLLFSSKSWKSTNYLGNDGHRFHWTSYPRRS